MRTIPSACDMKPRSDAITKTHISASETIHATRVLDNPGYSLLLKSVAARENTDATSGKCHYSNACSEKYADRYFIPWYIIGKSALYAK